MEVAAIFLIGLLVSIILFSISTTLIMRLTAVKSMFSRSDVGYFEEGTKVFVDTIGEENVVGKVGYESWRITVEGSEYGTVMASRIDIDFAEIIKAPLDRGHWFRRGDGTQVVVSQQLKEKYKLNTTYDFEVRENYSKEEQYLVSATVVGYLTDENYSIGMRSNNLYSLISTQSDMMFCFDTLDYVDLNGDTDYYKRIGVLYKYNDQTVAAIDQVYFNNEVHRPTPSLARYYDGYKQSQQPLSFCLYYCFLLVIGVSVVGLMMNSILNRQRKERYYSVLHVCGAPPWAVVLAQAIISVASIVITALLAYAICYRFTIPIGFHAVRIITWKGFWIGVGLSVAIEAISGTANAVGIYNIKPLKCLKKD